MSGYSPRIVSIDDTYVNIDTGALYRSTPEGKLVSEGKAAYHEVAAMVAGVNSEHSSGLGDVEKIAAFYEVNLSLESMSRIWAARSSTRDVCDLVIAIKRWRALPGIEDPDERKEHLAWLFSAASGLTYEPAWAYQLAQELEYFRALHRVEMLAAWPG